MKKVIKAGNSEIIEKKSRFIGNVYNVETEEQAVQIIAAIKKKYWDARHSCYAYIIGNDKDSQIQKFSDDGEPSGTAGKPILEVLSGNGMGNCLCIVTRYFGGVLLGTGGLVRAYSMAAKEALNDSETGELIDGAKAYIDVDYTYVGKIQYLCSQYSITIISTDYSQNVTFELMMDIGAENTFQNKLTELSAGKLKLRDILHIKMYRREDGTLSI